MMSNTEKATNVALLNSVFENLSETGKIMMITYSSALMDKELADKRAQPAAEPPELVGK